MAAKNTLHCSLSARKAVTSGSLGKVSVLTDSEKIHRSSCHALAAPVSLLRRLRQ